MKKIAPLIILFSLISIKVFSQDLLLPYTFENNSRYSDNEIYIGLVGKFGTNGNDVWMDMNDSSLVDMSAESNTVKGPEWSEPSSWKYPEIFTKLSDITNKTIQIPQGLFACRIFISFESPMFLHFHEAGGYAGANLNSNSDPNDGIRWELIELTWGDAGLWTNTSRVDAYQYPMGLEVIGFTGGMTGPNYTESYTNAINGSGTPKFGKVGELLPHQEILDRWDLHVSASYSEAKTIKDHTLDNEPIIEQPTKVYPNFNVLDDYIDAIWSTYSLYDLNINIGDRGTWSGRVNANNEFIFIDPVDGSIATIYWKPTTIGAIEGSDSLAYTPHDASINTEAYNEDLMIQAQIAAAISRHAIYTDIIDGSIQYSHDASRYFIHEPYNEYVDFFHNEQISFDSQTYAFAYDDVGDHSSTIQTTFPTAAKVIIGGYATQSVTEKLVLSSISITPESANLFQGNTQQFIATGFDQNNNIFSTNIIWSVDNNGTINNNGVFTAFKPGTYRITASNGSISNFTTVTVVETTETPKLSSIQITSSDTTEINTSKSQQFTATGYDQFNNVFETNIIWTTNNNGIVNTNGIFNTNELGEHIITATSGNISNSITVFVNETERGEETENFQPFKKLTLYPNPSSNQDSFLEGISNETVINLFSITGHLISTYNVTDLYSIKLDTSNLASGIYLVIASETKSEFSKTFKLIVN